jgi:hypothetical protein
LRQPAPRVAIPTSKHSATTSTAGVTNDAPSACPSAVRASGRTIGVRVSRSLDGRGPWLEDHDRGLRRSERRIGTGGRAGTGPRSPPAATARSRCSRNCHSRQRADLADMPDVERTMSAAWRAAAGAGASFAYAEQLMMTGVDAGSVSHGMTWRVVHCNAGLASGVCSGDAPSPDGSSGRRGP